MVEDPKWEDGGLILPDEAGTAPSEAWEDGGFTADLIYTSGGTDALTADDITTGNPVLGTPTIGQVHDLTADDIATGNPVIGTPTLAEGAVNLIADSILIGSPALGTPVIGQIHILIASGISARSPTFGLPSLDSAVTDTPESRIYTIAAESRTYTI